MSKTELGTKRVCPVTGRKFYDLNKDPVISPYTGEVVPIAPLPASRGRPDTAASSRVSKNEETVDRDEEFVSLEEADAENKTGSNKKKAATVDDDDIDIDSDDDSSDDDDTLIEDSEEGSDDVSDIIGDGREDEEET